MSAWSVWTNCRCGHTDAKTRTRSVTTQAIGQGFPCKHTQETGTCVMTPCHCPTVRPGYYGDRCDNRHCVLHPWSAWSPCACPGGVSRSQLASITPKKHRTKAVKLTKVGSGNACGNRWEENYCGFTCVQQCTTYFEGDAPYCNYKIG